MPPIPVGVLAVADAPGRVRPELEGWAHLGDPAVVIDLLPAGALAKAVGPGTGGLGWMKLWPNNPSGPVASAEAAEKIVSVRFDSLSMPPGNPVFISFLSGR
jgi:hypothetical protein